VSRHNRGTTRDSGAPVSQQTEEVPVATTNSAWAARLRNSWLARNGTIIAIFVVVLIITSIFVPNFLSISNIPNLLQQMSIVGIVAVGMTFVILTGGIDLSVGSNLAVSTVLYALALSHHLPSSVALLIALGSGLAFGIVNGVGIAVFNLQPFIMTLATLAVGQGVALAITNGSSVIFSTSDPLISLLGNGSFGPVPAEFVVFAVIVAVGIVVLRFTQYGRFIYATGGSPVAARLSGIKVNWIIFSVYAIVGLCSGLAGAMTAARLTTGEPTAGGTTNLDTIAAVVIGGTSLFGGIGGIAGTVMGSAVLAAVSNILNLLGVSPYLSLIVKGAIIAIAVLLISPDLRRWIRSGWQATRKRTVGRMGST
jgi:ribose transport system permease protein